MYMVDGWGVVYKIDVRSGTRGEIVWKMDPAAEKPDRNRGVALWGNLVISVTGYDGRVIATDKETGKIVWDKNLHDQPDLEITAAPLALKDEILIGGSGGDHGVRNWLAVARPEDRQREMEDVLDPGAGRARQRDLEGQAQRLADRRRRVLRHRLLRSRHQPDLLGLRQSGAGLRFVLSSRRQPLHQQRARLRREATGKIKWHFQYTPNDTATTTRPASTS